MKLSHRRSTAKYVNYPEPLTKRQFRRRRGRTGYCWDIMVRNILSIEEANAIYDRMMAAEALS